MEEAGRITLSSAQPVFDQPYTATLTDPDGNVSNPSWQWQSGNSHSGPFTNITGATSATYTPVQALVGKYLKVAVTYTDRRGSGKSAMAISDNPVVLTAVPAPPVFPNDRETFSVDEHPRSFKRLGWVIATDRNGDIPTYSVSGPDRDVFTHHFFLNTNNGAIWAQEGRYAIDYEAKRQYNINVTARDPGGLSDSVEVVITVNNVDEPGSITFSPSVPTAGRPIRATLQDPDGGITNLRWQWSISSWASGGSATDIDGATGSSYTVAATDLDRYLKVQATYTDGHGTDKTAEAVAGPVEAAATVRNLTGEVWPGTGTDKIVNMRVELRWEPAQGVSSYTIMRHDHEQDDRIVARRVRGTRYMDSGLVYGTEARYVVYPSTSADPPTVGHYVEGGDVVFVSMYEPHDAGLFPQDFEIHRVSGSNNTFRFTWSRPQDPRLRAWVDYKLVRTKASDDGYTLSDESIEVPITVSGASGRARNTITTLGVYYYRLELRIGPESGYGYTPGGAQHWRVDTTKDPAVIE